MVLAIVVGVLLRGRGALHDFVATFAHFHVARLPWLALAVGAEVLSFVCYSLVQRRLLLAGGSHLTRRTMLGLAVAATGITNLVPGGTAPASGWLVGQYRRRCIPMPLALWVVLAGGFAATLSILVLLLVGAAAAGLLPVWATVACAAFGTASAAAIVRGVHHLPEVRSWLEGRRRGRSTRWRRAVIHGAGTMSGFRLRPGAGAQVLGLSLANWSLDVVCLVVSFEVLDRPVPWHAVVFAYAVAQVAGSIAPVPGGIGFVEGGMVGAFALVGTPAGDALAATVVYRAITCWAVAGIGSLTLFVVEHRDAPCADNVEGTVTRLGPDAPT